MKVYTYSQARQNLSEVLNAAKHGEVLIRRRGGEVFSVVRKRSRKSPFDVPGVATRVTTPDILAAIREVRSRA
jgi:prevent-host-death family protein